MGKKIASSQGHCEKRMQSYDKVLAQGWHEQAVSGHESLRNFPRTPPCLPVTQSGSALSVLPGVYRGKLSWRLSQRSHLCWASDTASNPRAIHRSSHGLIAGSLYRARLLASGFVLPPRLSLYSRVVPAQPSWEYRSEAEFRAGAALLPGFGGHRELFP